MFTFLKQQEFVVVLNNSLCSFHKKIKHYFFPFWRLRDKLKIARNYGCISKIPFLKQQEIVVVFRITFVSVPQKN